MRLRVISAIPSLVINIPIKERLGGKNDPDYASTLSNIAVVYKNKGEYELALNKYEEAIRIEK